MNGFSLCVRLEQLVLVTVLVLFTQPSAASGSRLAHPDSASSFYPLSIGDYWEYVEYAGFGGGIVDTVSKTVISDTTIGSTDYMVIVFRAPHYGVQRESFERFDSVGDVRTYSNGTESLDFRFSDTSRTPWTFEGSLRRWERNYVDTVFGSPRHVLFALTYQSWDTLGYFGLWTSLIEGIGVTLSMGGEGGGYALRGAKIDGVVYGTITSVGESDNREFPNDYNLQQNYPNPFNSSTTIQFSIPVGTYGRTSLQVYDLLGHEVAVLVDEVKQPGTYTVQFDGRGLASGVYVYRLRAGAFVQSRKLLLLK
jgi:hypothetical protein